MKKQIRGGDSYFSVNRRSIVVTGDSRFNALPEECISKIISDTSPRDACVVSTVSKTFKSAADSDLVWEKFLPAEYWAALVPRSMNYSTKKEIYLSLVDDSVLIDGGKKSLWLEKCRGRKCFMLSAMDLTIVGGDSPDNWKWISDDYYESPKFEKVAKLLNVCWFEIRGKISSRMLSENTHYSVYVVYKRASRYSYGFGPEPVEARVGFVGKEATKKSVILDPFEASLSRRRCWRRIVPEFSNVELDVPKFREDRWWMESELGKFYIPKNGGDCEDDEIEISIMDTNMRHRKGGLIFRGIEIRPDEVISEEGEDDGQEEPKKKIH